MIACDGSNLSALDKSSFQRDLKIAVKLGQNPPLTKSGFVDVHNLKFAKCPDLAAAGQASGHVGCLAGSGGLVIDRVDNHVHADHFSHHALKFKKGLHLTFFRFR